MLNILEEDEVVAWGDTRPLFPNVLPSPPTLGRAPQMSSSQSQKSLGMTWR